MPRIKRLSLLERSKSLKEFAGILFGILALVLAGCSSESSDKEAAPGGETAALNELAPIIAKPSGVRYQDLRIGTGREIEDSMFVSHSYAVWFTDNDGIKKTALFHSSASINQPYYGQVGVTHLPGLSDGIRGMREGGRRRIFIPWQQAYPEQSPFAGRNLIFEIDSLMLVSQADVLEYQEHYNPRRFRDSVLAAQRMRKDSLAALGLDTLGQPQDKTARQVDTAASGH